MLKFHRYRTGNVAALAARLKINARPGSVHDRLANSLAAIAVTKPTVPQVAPSGENLDLPGPAAYELRISEAQRHYLIVALAQCQLQGYYGADQHGCVEIDLLHDMLADDANLEPLPACNDLTA
jgi:hypothetical protein